MGHCANLYQRNAQAIAALESRLHSYGYTEPYSPVPPENPLELLALTSSRTAYALSSDPSQAQSPAPNNLQNTLDRDSLSPLEMVPPATLSRYAAPQQEPPSTTSHRPIGQLTAAAAAMAPMTAYKTRMRNDTPSSLSSPVDALTPSMRHLLGKYATSSSSGGGGLSGLSGMSPAPLSAPRSGFFNIATHSPMLSPAFAAAAEQQRAHMDAIEGVQSVPVPTSSHHVQHHPTATPAEIDLQAADDYIASTAQKLASHPELLDSFREKYPALVASTERLMISNSNTTSTGDLTGRRESLPYGSTALVSPAVPDALDEDSTMELKSQVIYSRALAQQVHQASAPLPSGPSAVTFHHQQPQYPIATAPAAVPQNQQQQNQEAQRSRESLEEAIAAALARPSISMSSTGTAGSDGTTSATATATTTTAKTLPQSQSQSSSYAVPALHVTPAAVPMGGSSIASARTSMSSSLTPSLPSSVAPLRPVDQAEYSSLPAFIRGQLPLDALNEAAGAVHASALRRCAAGDGASFSMDDVENAGELPAGKGKVVVNALAKLGRVQLKVVYGQGTVYFFA